ncbi:MAG: type II toxin-antitoxin system RelB/DinJ family antitoxin [Prevotellaceae bacterium]|jgi:addiction module RelB/DinJ family antitoxin|nr:type II toxin-antitoxin system RelB/DinJ family antitoxin [Prevotellaceae bacterium]
MKNTVLVKAKIPADVKQISEQILNDFGLDLSSAIRLFLFKVKQTRSLPFSIGYENNCPPEISNGLSDNLLSIQKDIEQDKNIMQFADNEEGFNHLESLIR